MSISARFARLVKDAYTNNDHNAALDAYYDWQVKNCLHPYWIWITDSHTQQRRRIRVACGNCFHCRQTKINEWCTRMYAHAEDFSNVYFVTLTYRSITDPQLDVNRLLLSKLSQAVWIRDSRNYNHHLSYNPCLLVKKHYQDFLKRLRKNTGLKDISYVLSGEYGHDYGRPHFHLILFTNGTLTKPDVVRAWSVALWHSNSGSWSFRNNQQNNGIAYNFPIGNVDFHSLTTNGTFNTTAKIKVDGIFMNAANCFAYVCKYVCKQDKPNLSRVKLAYNNLYLKENFVKCFDNEIPYKICLKYLRENDVYYQTAEQITNSLKSYQYEKILYQPTDKVYSANLQNSCKKYLFGMSVDMPCFPSLFVDFRHEYRPFCEFSRGTPIGCLYAKSHLQEFTQGVFNKPLLQTSGFVVPNYFRTKARNYVYGLREVRPSLSGTTFAFGSMQNLLGHLQKCLETGSMPNGHFYSKNSSQDYSSYLSTTGRCRYADIFSGERIILCNSFARYFKYDRSQRKYINTRNISIPDFIRNSIIQLQAELQLHSISLRQSIENERYSESGLLMLTDLGYDLAALSEKYNQKQQHLKDERDSIYHSLHSSAE